MFHQEQIVASVDITNIELEEVSILHLTYVVDNPRIIIDQLTKKLWVLYETISNFNIVYVYLVLVISTFK